MLSKTLIITTAALVTLLMIKDEAMFLDSASNNDFLFNCLYLYTATERTGIAVLRTMLEPLSEIPHIEIFGIRKVLEQLCAVMPPTEFRVSCIVCKLQNTCSNY